MDMLNSKEFKVKKESLKVVDGRVIEIYTQEKCIRRETLKSFEQLKELVSGIMLRLDVESFLDLAANCLYNDTVCAKIADLVYQLKVKSGEVRFEEYPIKILRELSRTYRQCRKRILFPVKFYTYDCIHRGDISIENGLVISVHDGNKNIMRFEVKFYQKLIYNINKMAKYDPEEFMRMYHSLTADPVVKEIAEKIRVERREAYNKNPFDL